MMEVSEREVENYVRPDGRCPFEDWMTSLRDQRARARIRTRIDRVQLGNLGNCESVGGGVSELKIDMGQVIAFTSARLERSWLFCFAAGIRVLKVRT